MTLAELLRDFRRRSKDRAKPYLTCDEDAIDWLNEAQEEAALRGRLIREDDLVAVCQIPLTVGTKTYPLHPSVTEIISMWVVNADGNIERDRGPRLVTQEWLDRTVPHWREDESRWCHEYAVQDDTTIKLMSRIEVGDVLHMECYRLPIRRMANLADVPEIGRPHHRFLVEWALHQAYDVPDTDLFDPKRSAEAEKRFTDYFGERPNSNLRRATRTDEVQHNYPML